ncbi:unnamed protein product [Fusarium graminearum]|nr:hypothetical protein FG05_35404 [Fusarium graminearum]CAG1973242.1 unnamed protein product [Fusarium graminearum]VTO90892.1 unnamed protein product [Fusarium graminearum]
MHTDPYQMVNLYQSTGFLLGNPVGKVTSCLKGLMMVLKRCQGQQCVSHGIHYIQRVMLIVYATHFTQSMARSMKRTCHKFFFEECVPGFIISKEGPQVPSIFGKTKEEAKYDFLKGSHWADWA